jgi:hypothetical protein
VQLPAGRFWGRVQMVTDDRERMRIARQVLKNAGLAGFFFGFNPFTTSEEKLARGIAGSPVYRLAPARAVPAGFDPGGRGWVATTILWLALLAIVVVILSR